jgi:endonuclease YncB( thermonuclease family)
MIGGKRQFREKRSLAAIAVVAVVMMGLLAAWLPNAGAQDGTDFAGTAVAEFTPTTVIEPTPTPTPETITYDAPEFMDGSFRITVQRAAFGSAIDELELRARAGREWVAVIADVVNFSDVATNVQASQFSIRSGGVPLAGGLAKTTTTDVAGRLGITQSDPDDQMLLQPGQSLRLVLVFQLDSGQRELAIIYKLNALPLTARINQNLGFADLPPIASAPQTTNAIVESVMNGNTLTLIGDTPGTFDMTGVDAPVNNDCYATEASERLQSIIGATVLVEQPGNGQSGIYLWLPLPNGTRALVNQDMVLSGSAATNAKPGGRFTDWLEDSEFVAHVRTEGLWGRCTSQHGVNRPNTIERVTFSTAIDGGNDTSPYIPTVQFTPLILSLPDGGAIAFYTAEAAPADPSTPTPSDQIEQRLYYAIYDAKTGKWGTAEPLADGGRFQFGITGVVDSIGRVHVVFSDRATNAGDDVSNLKYLVREVNGDWTPPQDVSKNSTAGFQLSPSLAIDSSDTLYLVWQDQRLFSSELRAASSSNGDAFYATKPVDGKWSSAVSINKHSDNELISRPQIAIDGNRAVATWSVYDASNLSTANRIEWSYLTFGDDAKWAKPLTMIAGRGEAFGGRLVDLKADPTGGVIFVFARQSTDTFLFMRRLAVDSTEWEPDILLTYGNRGSFPSLTVAPDGTAYVAYNLGDGDEVDIAAVAVPVKSITPGPEVILTNDQEGAHGRPSITTDITGLPWVIYYSQPIGGTPDAVDAIRNFIIPRSSAELQSLIDAAGTPTP